MLLVGEAVHSRGSAVGIVRDNVPAPNDCHLLFISATPEKAGRASRAALRRGRATPFPIAFAELEAFGDAKLLGATIGVGFDRVGDDDFAGEARASGIVIEFLDGFGAVLIFELTNHRHHGHSEFAVEDCRAVFVIDIDVIFAEAGIDAVDDVVEVLVDKNRGGAEDNKVVVESGNGIVEIDSEKIRYMIRSHSASQRLAGEVSVESI